MAETVDRRKFLKTAALGGVGTAAATTITAPAIAQSTPEISRRSAGSVTSASPARARACTSRTRRAG